MDEEKKKYFKMMWEAIQSDINLDTLISEEGKVDSDEGVSYLYRFYEKADKFHSPFDKVTHFTVKIEFNVDDSCYK